jgi:creatinine amidohydrolase
LKFFITLNGDTAMKSPSLFVFVFAFALSASAQTLPVRWDELTVGDWQTALDRSQKTCILPMGVLEKHGLHAPVGTDLITVREWSAAAAKKEYAVVFPDFYFGQIYEARHQPGCFAPPPRLVWDVLEATCDEIARNGFEKILIVNGHGGNPNLIRYFMQSRLEKPRPYVVYLWDPPGPDSAFVAAKRRLLSNPDALDYHAGEEETSVMLHLRPELVKREYASRESGADLKRLAIQNVYTAIGWYASFPNQYAGDGTRATAALGKFITDDAVASLARTIGDVKADAKTRGLQDEFFHQPH